MTDARSPWWVWPVLAALLVMLIGGVGMWIYADNAAWLLLTVVAFVVLYAG